MRGWWLLCGSALLAACGHAPETLPPAAKSLTVQTRAPVVGEIIRHIRLPGTLRANQEVSLHAKAVGFVKTITKDRGDAVKAGEVVATLEIPELVTDLESARALYAVSDTTVRRLEAIRAVDAGAVPEQDLEVERAKRAAAEAARKRIEALIAYSEVKAPFDGVVTERLVDPGALVRESALLTLIDRVHPRMIVDVPEAEARFIALGLRGEATFAALPGKPVAMAVRRTANRIDPETRTLRIELESEAADPAWEPGMYALVALALERHAQALIAPEKALVIEQGRTCIYTLDEGHAHRHEVQIGIRDGEVAEVLSGLASQQTIIMPPAPGALRDGLAVAAEGK